MTAKAPAGGATATSTTIVAERVPLKLLKMETVEEYFSRFGALAHIEIDRARHQAIIDFEENVDAQTAVSSKEPIMDEPTVYLRFFRGSRPHPYAPRQDPPAPPPVNLPTALHQATDSNRGGGGSHTVHAHGQNIVLDNLVMESCDAAVRRQEREESQIKKKELMQKITDKMKTVMVRLTDSNLREDQKDQLQDLLMSLKKQLTSLTTPIGAGGNPANPAVSGGANPAQAGGGPPGMAPNQVLDLRSKVVRIEFKQGMKEKGDGDEKEEEKKDDDDELLKSNPTAALKKVCSEVDWASNELTVAWDDSQASEEGASKTKSIVVTFPDRRTAEHALGDLPRNLVSATFI